MINQKRSHKQKLIEIGPFDIIDTSNEVLIGSSSPHNTRAANLEETVEEKQEVIKRVFSRT